MIKNDYSKLKPARPDYRDVSVPTQDAFNWEDVIRQTDPGGIYAVEFTSRQNPKVVSEEPEKVQKLLSLDDAARVDAEGQPGFYHYFADIVAEDGSARSFCLWDTREDAVNASQREAHLAAIKYTFGEGKEVYEFYGIKKFLIEKTKKGLEFTTLSKIVVAHGGVVESWHQPVEGVPSS